MANAPIDQMYSEIHEHMRESHRKRDQLGAFYIALLAGLFAGWSALGDLLVPALGAVSVIGGAFFFILLQYRRWHIKYNNALTVFQALLASNDQQVTLKECRRLWEAFNDTRSPWALVNPLGGVESATNVGFLLVVAVPFHLLLQKLPFFGVAPVFGGDVACFAANVTIVVVLGLGWAARFLPLAQQFEPNDWMFRWLRPVQPTVQADGPACGRHAT